MLLERRLHTHVPLRGDVVRGLEDGLYLLWNFRKVNVTLLCDAGDEVLRVPTLLLGASHEGRVHIRHHRTGLVAHERDGENRFDTSGTPGEDRYGAGRRHRCEVAVPEPEHRTNTMSRRIPGTQFVRPPNGLLPGREDPSALGELLRRAARLLVQESHHLAAHFNPFVTVVGDPEPDEHVRPTHDSQANPADGLSQVGDRLQRIPIGVDDVIQEVRGQMDRLAECLPVHTIGRIIYSAWYMILFDELREIHASQVAYVVGQKRLLAARIRGLVRAELGHGVELVGPVDEKCPRLAGLPRAMNDHVEDLAGVVLAHYLVGLGVHQIVALARFDRLHERIGKGDGNVEIRDPRGVVLTKDERTDVRMIHPEYPHIRPAPRPALLHDFRARVIERHEGDRPRSHTRGRLYLCTGRPKSRKGEARTTTRLMNERHRHERIVDAALSVGERVVHRQDEAG